MHIQRINSIAVGHRQLCGGLGDVCQQHQALAQVIDHVCWPRLTKQGVMLPVFFQQTHALEALADCVNSPGAAHLCIDGPVLFNQFQAFLHPIYQHTCIGAQDETPIPSMCGRQCSRQRCQCRSGSPVELAVG